MANLGDELELQKSVRVEGGDGSSNKHDDDIDANDKAHHHHHHHQPPVSKGGGGGGGGSMTRSSVLALVVLFVQNTASALLTRYSRGVLKEQYNVSVGILMAEVGKIVISLALISRTAPHAITPHNLLHSLQLGYLLLVPATVYFMQNNLVYVVFANLDAGTAVVCQQLKILTSGFFTVTLLGRHLSARKWRALVLLTLGVILSVLKPAMGPCTKAADGVNAVLASNNNNQVNEAASSFFTAATLLGLTAAIAQAVGSGFAGVYFEKIIKHHAPSAGDPLGAGLWVRQYQLAAFSLVFAVFRVMTAEDPRMAEEGMFHDFSIWSWCVVLASVAGGCSVALVLKYADNIIKGYATCLSLIASSVLDYMIFGSALSVQFVIGAMVVIISLFNYEDD